MNVLWRPGDGSFEATRLAAGFERLMQSSWALRRVVASLYRPSVGIWFTEVGFPSRAEGDAAAGYHGTESATRALPAVAASKNTMRPLMPASSFAPDQAAQLRDAIELAYCQPYVTAIFNFQLLDEPSLRGWQSGSLYANWQRKASFATLAQVVKNVRGGHIDRGRFDEALQPVTAARQAPAAGPPAGRHAPSRGTPGPRRAPARR